MSYRLIQGDCLEVLPTLEAGSVDALVIDPPFGIGKTYIEWKEQNTPDQYWAWLRPHYLEALRCVRPGGFVAIWQTQKYMRHLWGWFGEEIHIYCAAKNFVQLRPTPINYGYDPVAMFYKPGGDALRPSKPRRNLDFFVANTAALVSNPKRPERAHPFPKPVDLMAAIITNFVIPGGVVLDCFAGSGSTGVAALENGYSFIGVEREAEYIEIARQRLEAASQQMRLAV